MSVKGNTGKAKNYFGTIAGVVCAGPVDELVSIIIDGMTVWPTDLGWADDIVNLPILTVQRTSNVARIVFATPHKLGKGKKFVISGLTGGLTGFNVGSPTTVTDASDIVIKFANIGANVGVTSVPQNTGVLTKVDHYLIGALVRYSDGIWQCQLAHDGTPDKAPPNATYWAGYSLQRGSNPNPVAITIATSVHTTHTNYGTAYFYWGTANQTLDQSGEATLYANGHPPYRHQAVIVLKNFLFGTERQGPPNIEVVVRRKPVQAVITGASANLDSDHQANPLTVEAEMFSDPIFGIGWLGSLDSTTWQAIADALAANSDKTYLSPLLDKADTARSFIASMLAYYDGWKRFNASGAIEAGQFSHNQAPPAFTPATTIDYNDLIVEIEWDSDLWASTFNETICKFRDRSRAFKDAAQPYVSGYNRNIVGEPRRAELERPWIVREAQALAYAAEWGKIMAQQKLGGTLTVRAEKATSIKPGDLFMLTHDAVTFSVICRCMEKTPAAPPAGQVTMRFESERGIAPIPYQPTVAPNGGVAVPHPELVTLYQFVQPPPALSAGADFQVSILAARTSQLTRGLRPWLKVDDSSNYYQLGEQRAWDVNGTLAQGYGVPAVKTTAERSRATNIATLKVTAHGYLTGQYVNVDGITGYNVSNVSITVTDADHFTYANTGANESVTADTGGTVTPQVDDDTENLQLNLAEFTVQPDIDKISVAQTADSINDNSLLVWIFNAASSAQFEICTVKAIRLDSGVYKLKVRRGRFGTAQRAAVTNDIAWIGFRSDLVTYAHAKFAAYAASATAATFLLQAFTANEEADLTDSDTCPPVSFTFSDPYAPVAVWTSLQKNGVDIASFAVTFLPADVFTFGIKFTDANGDLTEGKLVARLGSLEQTLWSQSFAASAQQLKTTSFSLATEGTWRVFAVAKDASGRVKEYELAPVGGGAAVQIQIMAAGSTVVATPVADNPGGDYPGTSITVALSCATAGATIEYSNVAYGAAPGGFTTYSTPLHISLGNPGRTLYARAFKGGMTTSATVRNDYWKSSTL